MAKFILVAALFGAVVFMLGVLVTGGAVMVNGTIAWVIVSAISGAVVGASAVC